MSNELDLTSNDAMHWAEQLEKHLKAGVAPDADYLVGWFANYWAAVHDPLKRKIEELEAALQPSLPQDVEPVAWHTEDHLTDRSATTYDRECVERWLQKGWPVTPMYYSHEGNMAALPQDVEERIEKEAFNLKDDHPGEGRMILESDLRAFLAGKAIVPLREANDVLEMAGIVVTLAPFGGTERNAFRVIADALTASRGEG